GETPLHIAAGGHGEHTAMLAEILLDSGADARAKSRNGSTPLHGAVERGHAGLVDLLLEKGADPAAARRGGTTPLHVAAAHGEVGIARVLLGKLGEGVDLTINLTSGNGKTPLHLAAKHGDARLGTLHPKL
ncbi:ankyrin repeat-containing domain protein, partial [Baffinella frigidus]